MTDLKLYDGCFVHLANGKFLGPVDRAVNFDPPIFHFEHRIGWTEDGRHDANKTPTDLDVTAVYATLQEAAGHDHTEAVLDWLKQRGLSVSDLSDPGAVTDQLSWYERAIFEERASPLSQIPSEGDIDAALCDVAISNIHGTGIITVKVSDAARAVLALLKGEK